MSMLEFIKYSKNKMIKKILILLPIVALSACAIGKNQEEKEIESQCNYYKNTQNIFNEKLFVDYSKAKSAYLILEDKKFSCNNSICKTLANGNKWDFIEVELDGDPSNQSAFPKKGDSGLYKISKNYEMYEKFEKIQNDPKNLTMISLLCDKTANCVSCSTGPFCLVGDKIKNVDSKMTIYKKILADNDKKNSSILLNYVVTLNNKKILSYNRYIYSNYNPYTSYGKTICTNTNFIKPLLLDILGGYKYE